MDDDLKTHLDRNFQHLGQQVQHLREETDRQFREMREETAQKFQEMGGRMDRIETKVREAGVLIEGLQDQVRFVAEGVDNLREQMERNDKELSRKVDEVMTFTRQAYRDLDARKLDKTA